MDCYIAGTGDLVEQINSRLAKNLSVGKGRIKIMFKKNLLRCAQKRYAKIIGGQRVV